MTSTAPNHICRILCSQSLSIWNSDLAKTLESGLPSFTLITSEKHINMALTFEASKNCEKVIG